MSHFLPLAGSFGQPVGAMAPTDAAWRTATGKHQVDGAMAAVHRREFIVGGATAAVAGGIPDRAKPVSAASQELTLEERVRQLETRLATVEMELSLLRAAVG